MFYSSKNSKGYILNHTSILITVVKNAGNLVSRNYTVGSLLESYKDSIRNKEKSLKKSKI